MLGQWLSAQDRKTWVYYASQSDIFPNGWLASAPSKSIWKSRMTWSHSSQLRCEFDGSCWLPIGGIELSGLFARSRSCLTHEMLNQRGLLRSFITSWISLSQIGTIGWDSSTEKWIGRTDQEFHPKGYTKSLSSGTGAGNPSRPRTVESIMDSTERLERPCWLMGNR